MDATLNVTTKLLAFTDQNINSNPRKRSFDWTGDVSGVEVSNPQSELLGMAPGETKTLFSGMRSTTIDGTTAFAVSLSNLDPSRYRFTNTGGTAPGLRIGRGLTLNTFAVTVTVNANSSATFSVPNLSASNFTAVQVGDTVFVPGISTGDTSSVFNESNVGYWTVLSKASIYSITLVRLPGQSFEAYGQTVTLTSNTQLSAFGSTGVQIGDTADVLGGFTTATLRAYEVVAVTDTFFEVISGVPLATETGILPTATGLIFYYNTKNFVYLEADQEVVVRLNGDTGNFLRVVPVGAADPTKVGTFMVRGPVYSLTIYNRSAFSAEVLVLHAE